MKKKRTLQRQLRKQGLGDSSLFMYKRLGVMGRERFWMISGFRVYKLERYLGEKALYITK
jgi:hypothetical protein